MVAGVSTADSTERGLSRAAAAEPAKAYWKAPQHTAPARPLRSGTLRGPLERGLSQAAAAELADTSGNQPTRSGFDNALRTGTVRGPSEQNAEGFMRAVLRRNH